MKAAAGLAGLLAAAVLAGGGLAALAVATKPEPRAMAVAVHWIEIPVTDMARARAFYEALFDVSLESAEIDGYEMALFPEAEGARLVLAKGDAYQPSRIGAIVYLTVADLESTLAHAEALGAPVLYPLKAIGENGFVAEIADSEGNRIALHQAAAP